MKMVSFKQQTKKTKTQTALEVSYFGKVSDEEIWRRFKKGDETAFAHIYKEYISGLFNFGCQVFLDRELVKDCIQDLFIDLKNRRQKLSDVKSIKAYLYKCLYHLIKKKLKKRNISLDIENSPREFFIDIPIDDLIVNSETMQTRVKWLQESLNELNKRQRQAILLYFYEGLNYEEINEIMGNKSVDGTRMLIKRGLDRLKENAKGNQGLYATSIGLLPLLKIF